MIKDILNCIQKTASYEKPIKIMSFIFHLNTVSVRCWSYSIFCCFYKSLMSTKLLISYWSLSGISDDKKSTFELKLTSLLLVIDFFPWINLKRWNKGKEELGTTNQTLWEHLSAVNFILSVYEDCLWPIFKVSTYTVHCTKNEVFH